MAGGGVAQPVHDALGVQVNTVSAAIVFHKPP